MRERFHSSLCHQLNGEEDTNSLQLLVSSVPTHSGATYVGANKK